MKQPFVYYGGKQLLKNEILRLIPKHDIYVETCLGGGTIFWNKERSKVEVINDLNDLIVIFYRVCVLDFDNIFIKLTKIKGKFLLSSYPSEILEKFKIEKYVYKCKKWRFTKENKNRIFDL